MVVSSVCSNAKVMLDISVVDVYKRREKKTHIMCFCTKSMNFACTCLNQSPPIRCNRQGRIIIPSQPNVLWQVKIMK